MGKLIVPLIIGLLLGLSGGGFFGVYKAGQLHATAVAAARKHGPAAAGDSAHAQGDSSSSTSHKAASADSARLPGNTHDVKGPVVAAATKPGVDTAHASAVAAPHGAPAPTVTPPTAGAAPSVAGAATAAETQAHQRRLAKIFGTMGAKDAARVLGQMTDHDVSIILGLLGDRQTAAILTNLPAPRAAALSQVQPPRGGSQQ